MSHAKLLDLQATKIKGFNLKEYIESDQEFSYPRSNKSIKIRVIFSSDAAFHLSESKLSEYQSLTTMKDGRILLETTVPDTEDLRWWLRGFGSQVEVLSPISLREEMAKEVDLLNHYYN